MIVVLYPPGCQPGPQPLISNLGPCGGKRECLQEGAREVDQNQPHPNQESRTNQKSRPKQFYIEIEDNLLMTIQKEITDFRATEEAGTAREAQAT